MIWTTKKPTKPGWYWWRRSEKRSPMITEVSLDDGKLVEVVAGVAYDLEDGEWSSTPVPEPEEQP